MRTLIATMLSTVALSGCMCSYGGPGCGEPWMVGLCAPVVPVETPLAVEVDYGDDTGLHAAEVTVARISDPAVIGVWPGATTGSLSLFGLAPGLADVELEVAGWEHPGVVQFEVTAGPPPTCDSSPYGDPPAFAIPIVAR